MTVEVFDCKEGAEKSSKCFLYSSRLQNVSERQGFLCVDVAICDFESGSYYTDTNLTDSRSVTLLSHSEVMGS